MMKYLFGLFIALTPLSTFAWGSVTIEEYLSITPSDIPFETVFPEEILFRPLFVSLSNSFFINLALDDVEYHIEQWVKPKVAEDAEYCKINPTDYTRCYLTLCPYLSKEADQTPLNDTSVPAFHDPNAAISIAYGYLAKSDADISDNWTIDLHVPCFRGQCAQDNVVPRDYELDPIFESQTFGCDLKFIIDRISYRHEQEGTIGFWRNWNRHRTYSAAEINGWLATINTASGWIMTEAGYPANTTGMVNLINASTGCSGSTRSCAKLKFAAQYMVTNLNVSSGRKDVDNPYNLNTSQQSYLGLTSPAALSIIFTKTEGKLPDTGTTPTRAQFLIMQSLFDSINNTAF